MTGAAADDGTPDARLARALAADDGSPAARGEVLAALAGARVFLALAAQALGTEPSAVPGLRQESAAQMSLLSLVSSGGARALPAFADGHEVQRWRPDARPVPVPGPLACRTALEDGAQALLLDPAGAAVVVDGAALRESRPGGCRCPARGCRRGPARPSCRGTSSATPGLLAALAAAVAPEDVAAARLLAGRTGRCSAWPSRPASTRPGSRRSPSGCGGGSVPRSRRTGSTSPWCRRRPGAAGAAAPGLARPPAPRLTYGGGALIRSWCARPYARCSSSTT